MNLINLYISLVRAALVLFSVYHICKHEYKLIISTGSAFILTFFPRLLENVFNIRLDITGSLLYVTIIFMTIYLGNALRFYDKYYWWDMLIHFLSGIAFVSFGITVSENAGILNRFHILFFCFTFSISLHVIWEVLEYISDCIFHTDNQRWQKVHITNNHVSESAIQPAGLVDTMNDIIICIAGTIVSCVAWWFVL